MSGNKLFNKFFPYNYYNFLFFKVVSYAKFLYPTNALVVRKADSHSAVPSCRASASRSLPGSRYKPVTAKTIPAGTDIGKNSCQLCHHLCTQQESVKGIYLSETIASGKVHY